MKFLLDAGWSPDRKIVLPDYILKSDPSPKQLAFFESFWGLSITDLHGYSIDFSVREFFENPFGETFDMVNVFAEMVGSLSDLGIKINSAIPFCELPYAQDFRRIIVDRDLNFFNICEDEALFIGRGPWWAFQTIYSQTAMPYMYLMPNGFVEDEFGTRLFELNSL